jgi:predicted Fe-S protein YdhL (DUF1289 family)
VWPDAAVAFPGALLIFALNRPIQAMARIDSPCNKICVVRPGGNLCVGCGRTLEEIAGWTAFTTAQRQRIMADLPRRLALVRDHQPAYPVA